MLGEGGERCSLGLTRLRQYFCWPDPPQPARKVYTATFRSRKKGIYHLDLQLSLNRPDAVQLALPATLPLEQVLIQFQQHWPEWFRTLAFLGIEVAGQEGGAGAVTYLAPYFQGKTAP